MDLTYFWFNFANNFFDLPISGIRIIVANIYKLPKLPTTL